MKKPKKPKFFGRIVCPDKNGKIKGKPMWKLMAFPFHIIDKNCKKCGRPVVEHGLVMEKNGKTRL